MKPNGVGMLLASCLIGPMFFEQILAACDGELDDTGRACDYAMRQVKQYGKPKQVSRFARSKLTPGFSRLYNLYPLPRPSSLFHITLSEFSRLLAGPGQFSFYHGCGILAAAQIYPKMSDLPFQ